MRIVNLTSNVVNLMIDGCKLIIPSSGTARCQEARRRFGRLDIGTTHIPIDRTYDKIEGLPRPLSDVVYITSDEVARAARREDVVTVYDSNGNSKLMSYL